MTGTPFFSRWRIWITRLFCVAIVGLFLVSLPAWHHHDGLMVHLITPLGLILASIGAIGRLWCSSYAAGNKNSRLLREGPYSLTRNPLYGFSFLGGLGVAITTETFTIPALFVAGFALYYHFVITEEEKRLQVDHGEDYATYQVMVPRFIPRTTAYVEPQRWEISPSALRRSMGEVIWFVIAAVSIHALHDLRGMLNLPTLLVLP